MERADEHGFAGTRLVQVAYHNRSLCLYAKLGFDVRESLQCTMQGPSHGYRDYQDMRCGRPPPMTSPPANGLSRRLLEAMAVGGRSAMR